MIDKFDTDCTREIICPHCGYEFGNSWESMNAKRSNVLNVDNIFGLILKSK